MSILLRLCRSLSLMFLAVLGTSVLMYTAPGYFSDVREMDASHGGVARIELGTLQHQQSSLGALLKGEILGWAHGDLGQSRQFGTPVAQLLTERTSRSVRLLASGLAVGWAAALLLAVPLSLSRRTGVDLSLATLTAIGLAVPIGALATFGQLMNVGSPAVVLGIVVAVRDTKLLHRLLQSAWKAPHVLHAQAQGLSSMRILSMHIVPRFRRELFGIAILSFTLALSAMVPVEVIFDSAGLGQLAWSAAMNRDLPVLIGVTAMLSACVGVAGCLSAGRTGAESTSCV